MEAITVHRHRVCVAASYQPIVLHKEKVQDGVEWVMRKSASLGGVGARAVIHTIPKLHPSPLQRQQPRYNDHHRVEVSRMADEAKKRDDLIEKEKKKEEEEAEELPPLPEKPLPGDCCGSGCVRCVWDVYYEELEEYNNRLKNDAQSKS